MSDDEARLPLGPRLALAFVRFLRTAIMILIVLALMSGFFVWGTAATAEDPRIAFMGTIVGLVGILVANVLHAVTLILQAFSEQIVTARSGEGTAEDYADWRVLALRDFLAFAETSVIFVFGVQALIAACVGISQGFEEARWWSIGSGLVLAVGGSWSIRLFKEGRGGRGKRSQTL